MKDSSHIPALLRQPCAATIRDMLFHFISSTRKSLAWDGNMVCSSVRGITRVQNKSPFFLKFLTPSKGMKWKQPSNKCIISKMHFQFIFIWMCTTSVSLVFLICYVWYWQWYDNISGACLSHTNCVCVLDFDMGVTILQIYNCILFFFSLILTSLEPQIEIRKIRKTSRGVILNIFFKVLGPLTATALLWTLQVWGRSNR